VGDTAGGWGAQTKGVFAQNTIDGCTKASTSIAYLVKGEPELRLEGGLARRGGLVEQNDAGGAPALQATCTKINRSHRARDDIR